MTPTARVFLAAGGIAGFAAVALGAFGAHALKGRLSPEMFAVWHTAVEYHVFHALGMLAVGLTAAYLVASIARLPRSPVSGRKSEATADNGYDGSKAPRWAFLLPARLARS